MADPLRFFDLPAEVRVLIYRAVFAEASITVKDAQILTIPELAPVTHIRLKKITFPWQLRLVCRQISDEAAPILHQSTYLRTFISSSGYLHHLERLIPGNLLVQLTRLRINLKRPEYVQKFHHSHLISLLPKLKELLLVLDFRKQAKKFIRDITCKRLPPDAARGNACYSDDDFHRSLLCRDMLPAQVEMSSLLLHPLKGGPKGNPSMRGVSCSLPISQSWLILMLSG